MRGVNYMRYAITKETECGGKMVVVREERERGFRTYISVAEDLLINGKTYKDTCIRHRFSATFHVT